MKWSDTPEKEGIYVRVIGDRTELVEIAMNGRHLVTLSYGFGTEIAKGRYFGPLPKDRQSSMATP